MKEKLESINLSKFKLGKDETSKIRGGGETFRCVQTEALDCSRTPDCQLVDLCIILK